MLKNIIANWRQKHDRPLRAQIKTLYEQLQIEQKKNEDLKRQLKDITAASITVQKECQALLTALCLNLKKVEVAEYKTDDLLKKYEMLSEKKDGIVKISVKKRKAEKDTNIVLPLISE